MLRSRALLVKVNDGNYCLLSLEDPQHNFFYKRNWTKTGRGTGQKCNLSEKQLRIYFCLTEEQCGRCQCSDSAETRRKMKCWS